MPTSSELPFGATVKRAVLELIMNWMLFLGPDLRLALNFFILSSLELNLFVLSVLGLGFRSPIAFCSPKGVRIKNEGDLAVTHYGCS